MYHYVRELEKSRYPGIKGLATSQFEEQIKYIRRYYKVINGSDLVEAVSSGGQLPPRSLLLTFDDGYIDHFETVFPILKHHGLTGCFFPTAKATLEHTVLDVNKIHFVLAAVANKNLLVDHICTAIDQNRTIYNLRPTQAYLHKFAKASRFDPAEVIFCKCMLQFELPIMLRESIVNDLFARYVTTDQGSFAKELYMSADQICFLLREGMYVGSHGYDHVWQGRLSANDQVSEIDRSLSFLDSLGVDLSRWMMSYPYGSYDESLLSIVQSRNCAVGLTTNVGLAFIGKDNPLTLSRIDTNDLPKLSDASANEWTISAGTR